jgi:antitoxin ParD1/3/4
MNVSFTKKQEEYISNQIESGDFQNASEVVRDALRLHEVYRHRVIQDLKAEIEKGWNDVLSSRSIKDIIQAKKNKINNV